MGNPNSIQINKNGMVDYLESMVKRGRSASAFLARVIYPSYQKAQAQRWITEGSSQGSHWDPIQLSYAERKKKKYAQFPGSGNALLVGTGALLDAATGRGKGALLTITDTSMIYGISHQAIPYAGFVNEKRDIITFSSETRLDWKRKIIAYLKRGL